MPPPAAKRDRNRLIDIFRGLALLLIFLAHTPGNDWQRFRPGAWGFSDATEIFVFVSGMAVGYAFVPAFAGAGFGVGTFRIARRAWQVYLAHICMFVAVAATVSAADALLGGTTHTDFLNLRPFFDAPQTGLVGLVTLTYVPNLFDILPMYIVILAMVPGLVLLARLSPLAPIAASVLIYVAVTLTDFNLPAEPWSDRGWFFNPLCWQILFVIGLSFTAGWLPMPRLPRALAWAALVFVLVSAPLANFDTRAGDAVLEPIYAVLEPYASKTYLGPLRILHFFALAVAVVGLLGEAIRAAPSRPVLWLERIGRQSLIVFVTSTVLAQLTGIILFETANTWATTLAATVIGFFAIYWIARAAAKAKATLVRPLPAAL